MKQCCVCGEIKAPDQFQRRMASPDHLTAACKECLRKRDRARYPKERARQAAAHRIWASTPKGKAAIIANKRRWQSKPENAVKRACHVIVGNALRDGKLTKKPCEVCGEQQAEAHHDDYSIPLAVMWLCRIHHKQRHKQNMAAISSGNSPQN